MTRKELLRQAQAALEAEVSAASAELKAVCPDDLRTNGLAPEHIRTSTAYFSAKSRFNCAHRTLREFNGKFAKELRA